MWQARAVFISSTFADMQAERDYLRTRVFPELEERLRARRHNLEWVDLRVGVATASQPDEHVREMHVLKVCLDEVRRCRPFLIVLLGDRYGWVPPEERIKAAAEEAREGFSADVAGRSVTDLEIEFGVLSDPEQQPRSFFYFREPLPYAEMPAETAALYCEDHAADPAKADRKARLGALKRRIVQQLPARVRGYAATWDGERHRVGGLDDFGRMVLDDIWSELEAETGRSAVAADIPWQEAERQALDDFIDDRARDFVGRQGLLASLTNLVTAAETTGAPWGACVTGDPGSGKSALFGALYSRPWGSDAFVLAHAAGASLNAASVDSMLVRWIGELAAALGTDPGLAENADPDTVDATFARLLGQMAQQRRVVVLVDALDQFENTTRGRHATWLPRSWPANARFIATAIAGDASKALAERQGIEARPMPPLDAAEARDIIAGICRRYHRAFEPEVIEALLAKRGPDGMAWGNPLWLVLAVEDLNLLDADDFARAHRDYAGAPAERLCALMLDTVAVFPPDIPGLYAQAFEHAEELFGASLTHAFLGLLAASRAGWRETDFRILLPRASGEDWDELKFAQLRRVFRGQMRRRGDLAQWDFSHAQMRAAVRARLAGWGISDRHLHTLIVDRLLSARPTDPLRLSETMVHLLGSADWARAARHYGASDLAHAEIEHATRAMVDFVLAPDGGRPADAALTVCRLLDASPMDTELTAAVANRFLYVFNEALHPLASIDVKTVVNEHIRKIYEQLIAHDNHDPQWRDDLSSCLDVIGRLLTAQGNLAAAREVLERAMLLAADVRPEASRNPMSRRLRDAQRSLRSLAALQGDYGSALRALEKGLPYTREMAAAHAGSFRAQLELASDLHEIGDYRKALGDRAGSLSAHEEACAIRHALLIKDPDNVDRQDDFRASQRSIGDLLLLEGEYDRALTAFRVALEITRGVVAKLPANQAWRDELADCLERVGDALLRLDTKCEALAVFREALGIRRALAAADPQNALVRQRGLANIEVKVGDALFYLGDRAGALASYRDALEASRSLAAMDALNAFFQRDLSLTIDRIGDVLAAGGDCTGAVDEYEAALAIRHALSSKDSSNLGYKRDIWVSLSKISKAYMTARDPARALPVQREAVKAIRELAERERDDAGWRCDVGLTLQRLGDTLAKVNDVAGALNAYREGLDIMRGLVSDNPTNALWTEFALSMLEQIAELKSRQHDLQAALQARREMLRLLRPGNDRRLQNAEWRRHEPEILRKLGELLMALGDSTAAIAAYRESLDISRAMAADDAAADAATSASHLH